VRRNRLDPTVRQSVIERLIDREPRMPEDLPVEWEDSVALKRDSVRRDLEWLLNTRRTSEPAPAEFPEVQNSVFHFGLPDLTSLSADSAETRHRLLREVEACIRAFEPRLTSVRVSAGPGTLGSRHQVRFMVEALLRLDPNPERVVFDTVLEVTSGTIRMNEVSTDAG
jgi:type VI secretion system protein ImpF